MSSNPRRHSTPRARPVAEAPVGALLARADELARDWVVALILARPLERIGELHLETLAREAPALCAQMIRALSSDAELERIAAGDPARSSGDSASAVRLQALAGPGDAQSAIAAIEALRGVLWEALLEELRWPTYGRSPTREVADLSDRLAYICATVLSATVAAEDAEEHAPAAAEGREATAGDLDRPAGDPDRSPIGPHGAILIDERDQQTAGSAQAAGPERGPERVVDSERRSAQVEQAWPREAPPRLQTPREQPSRRQPPRPAHGRPLPWDLPPAPSGARVAAAPQVADGPQIEVRDERGEEGRGEGVHGAEVHGEEVRGEEGPAAWISSIGHQLERFEGDHQPFAVLLVELGDVESLRRAALPGGLSSLTSRIERALAQELRRRSPGPADGPGRAAGSFTCERPGRYWLLVPHTDAAGAGRLADWVVRTLGPLAGPRWAPLEVTVGRAVCPEDGREAAALAAHADLGLVDARAAGR
jgi:hypothetical protein